jgi:hypothetical protein
MDHEYEEHGPIPCFAYPAHIQHFSNGFLPPPAQLQLSITPGAFAAACARACSLTAAGPSVIQAIAKSTQELLYIFIDDDPPDPLRILPDANSLADAKLVSLAHDVGAAVADLYLDRLGFHWRANGKSVIKSGSVPDMFYDNGHAGTASVVDVVAVEAKHRRDRLAAARRFMCFAGTVAGATQRADVSCCAKLTPARSFHVKTIKPLRLLYSNFGREYSRFRR